MEHLPFQDLFPFNCPLSSRISRPCLTLGTSWDYHPVTKQQLRNSCANRDTNGDTNGDTLRSQHPDFSEHEKSPGIFVASQRRVTMRWCFVGDGIDGISNMKTNEMGILTIMTGWWYEPYPSEKWWTSSVGIMTFPTDMEKCSKLPIR